MAYSQALADRVRTILRPRRDVMEKKMFGGLGFMLNGNMLVGIWQASLIVRLGPEQATQALRQPDVRQFDVTGRPMQGWIMVDPDGLEHDSQLAGWIDQAIKFVASLPGK